MDKGMGGRLFTVPRPLDRPLGLVPLQAKKTYHAYHTESLSAEAKLREAERQEEKRAGRTVTTTTTDAGPVRKGSLKKCGRLVEKVM